MWQLVSFCFALFLVFFVCLFVGKWAKLLEGRRGRRRRATRRDGRRVAWNLGLSSSYPTESGDILLILSKGVELLTCSSGSEVIWHFSVTCCKKKKTARNTNASVFSDLLCTLRLRMIAGAHFPAVPNLRVRIVISMYVPRPPPVWMPTPQRALTGGSNRAPHSKGLPIIILLNFKRRSEKCSRVILLGKTCGCLCNFDNNKFVMSLKIGQIKGLSAFWKVHAFACISVQSEYSTPLQCERVKCVHAVICAKEKCTI